MYFISVTKKQILKKPLVAYKVVYQPHLLKQSLININEEGCVKYSFQAGRNCVRQERVEYFDEKIGDFAFFWSGFNVFRNREHAWATAFTLCFCSPITHHILEVTIPENTEITAGKTFFLGNKFPMIVTPIIDISPSEYQKAVDKGFWGYFEADSRHFNYFSA